MALASRARVRNHGDMQPDSPKGPVERPLMVLEVVAERGGASAKEIAHSLDLPLPTVYRIANSLVDSDYLVHIRAESRYELGTKLHLLGQSLHRQVGIAPGGPRDHRLHEDTSFAAYLTVLRGAELVIVYVVDSPELPPQTLLPTMHFGFHDVPHSTAFGKILLAEQDVAGRELYLNRYGMRGLTANTITDRATLPGRVARRRPARGGLGARGVSRRLGLRRRARARPARGADRGRRGVGPARPPTGQDATVEAKLRNVAGRVSRLLHGGGTPALTRPAAPRSQSMRSRPVQPCVRLPNLRTRPPADDGGSR